ncbi:TPA: Ig-like domain-containing protein, partial [Vibrio cholerae]
MRVLEGKAGKSVFTLSTLTASCLMAFSSYAAVDCSTLPEWQSSAVYTGGAKVQHKGNAYQANYWTQNNDPETFSGNYAQWKLLDSCSTSGGTNQAPSVTLTAPLATAQVKAGEVMTLAANASDADGSVARVEFSVDGVLVGQATKAPYSASWTATKGTHEFSAVAFDDKGAVSTKNAVTLTVSDAGPANQAPTVAVALSASSVDVGTVVTLSAEAADADGSVEKVDFYVGGALVGTSAKAPYTLN